MNVPIEVRSHELKQVKTMLSTAIDELESAEADVEEISRVYEEHILGMDNSDYLSMPADDWRLVIRYLNRARRTEGRTRVHWLQTKFVNRLNERMEEMEDE